MKKLFSIISSGLVIAFALQSCNQPKVDMAKEMAMVDSLATAKVTAYRDSLNLICMNNIMVLAQAKADSMMTAAMKKTAPGAKPKPKPVAPAKPAPKPGLSGLSDQNKSNEGLKGLSDQSKQEEVKKGTGGLKGLSDSAKKTPPKQF